MRIIYYTVAWNNKYINFLMDYSLPSMMSIKNYDAVKNKSLHIYTDQNGTEQIKAHKNFQRVKDTFSVNICNCSWIGYETIQKAHYLAAKDVIEMCNKKKAIFRLFPPDAIFSDGFLTNTLKKIEEGYKATILPVGAFRVSYVPFIHNEVPAVMNSRDMVKYFLENMHKETKAHFYDSKEIVVNPVQLLFGVKDGLVCHSIYHQPGYINPCGNELSGSNLEFDFVSGLVPDENDVYVTSDSDEGFELSFKTPTSQLAAEVIEDSSAYPKFLSNVADGHNMSALSYKCFNDGYYAHTGNIETIEVLKLKDKIDHLKSFINKEVAV